MNCHDAQPWLDQVASKSGKPDAAGPPGLQQHLATCSRCQQALEAIGRWDDQLTTAMSDIVIPSDMSLRLIAQLHRSSTGLDHSNSTVSVARARIGLRILTAVTLVGLFVGSIWMAQGHFWPPALSTTCVARLLRLDLELFPTTSVTDKSLPQGWLSLRGMAMVDGRQAELTDFSVTIDVISFELRSKGSPPCEGQLLIIPKSRWTPIPQSSVMNAAIQYAPPQAWIVWSEREFVYLVAVNGSSQLLEQLQQQLGGNRSVL